MSQSKKRRQWSAAEKMRIVCAGMEAATEISKLCRVEGISPTLADSEKLKHMMEQHDFNEARDVMADTLKQLIDRLQYGDGQAEDE